MLVLKASLALEVAHHENYEVIEMELVEELKEELQVVREELYTNHSLW